MIGQERTVLPLLADRVFGLTAYTAALTFILAFGATKAATNFFAGTLSDRHGRKPVLVAGWLVALPIPFLLMWAPAWGWIIFANVLLGVNQGLTWSTTVIMKIDLVGPRGAGSRWDSTKPPATAPSPSPRSPPASSPPATGCGPSRSSSASPSPDSASASPPCSCARPAVTPASKQPRTRPTNASLHGELSTREVFALTSFTEPALSSCSQAGMVNNLNDGLAWGLFPLYFAAAGLSVGRIGVLAALYPAVWGLGQLGTGALSDRIGRKWLIVGGMLTQAVAIGLIAATTGFAPWAAGAVLLGAGTAMVYPTLLAAIGDVAHPAWRASSVGIYRLWRDGGFAVGALLAGVIADAFGHRDRDLDGRRAHRALGPRRRAPDVRNASPRT